MLSEETKEKIKDAILDYCEGIYHKEFSIDDLDNMVNDIETIVENQEIK